MVAAPCFVTLGKLVHQDCGAAWCMITLILRPSRVLVGAIPLRYVWWTPLGHARCSHIEDSHLDVRDWSPRLCSSRRQPAVKTPPYNHAYNSFLSRLFIFSLRCILRSQFCGLLWKTLVIEPAVSSVFPVTAERSSCTRRVAFSDPNDLLPPQSSGLTPSILCKSLIRNRTLSFSFIRELCYHYTNQALGTLRLKPAFPGTLTCFRHSECRDNYISERSLEPFLTPVRSFSHSCQKVHGPQGVCAFESR